MFIPKFGSSFTVGRVPVIRPNVKGPSATVMRVGIGPPAPCVIEYIFHPPPMLAVSFAVPRPPAGTLAGETLIESETGPCAVAVNEHTAMTNSDNKEIENLELKMRIDEPFGHHALTPMLYSRETSGNSVFIRRTNTFHFDAFC